MRLKLNEMRIPQRLWKALLILTALLAGAGAAGYGQPIPEAPSPKVVDAASDSLTEARALARAGRFDAAAQALRAYLSGHPGDSAALYELGSVLQRENKPKESLASYTEAAKGRTPAPEDLRIVALDYVLLEDYPDAVRWLERALADDPANAQTWYDLGRAQMMQQDFPAAEKALKRSLELIKAAGGISESSASTESVKAENNLGVTYESEGRSAEAAEAYKTAIAWQREVAHPSEQPLLNYGKLLIDQNRSEEAAILLDEAVRIAPNDPKCHEQLARALDRSGAGSGGAGQAELAEKEMLEAIRLDPTNARLHFQLGLMYRHAGKAELSREQMALSSNLYGSHSTPSDH